jgi:hypothetical protein
MPNVNKDIAPIKLSRVKSAHLMNLQEEQNLTTITGASNTQNNNVCMYAINDVGTRQQNYNLFRRNT